MKKLLLLFISFAALSCSNDDSPAPANNNPINGTIQIVSHNYTLFESNQIGKRFTFTATVKNNKTTPVNGMVKFDIPNNGGGTTFVHIQDVTLNAGETKTVSHVDGTYFQTETLNITSVTFVEAE